MSDIKTTIANAVHHFNKICTHKYWVAKYCFKCGLYWQGITHDLSKFSPTEFWESVKYYRGDSSPINAAKADKGYSLAWQHHKGRNPHHYEYWTDNYDKGTTCIRMPYKYVIELICDWIGAGRAYQGKNFTYTGEYKYVQNKLETAKMHQDTKYFIDFIFENLMKMENKNYPEKSIERFILNEEILKKTYLEFIK